MILTSVEFTIPGHLPSRANLRQHWRARHAMARNQRLSARTLAHQFVGFDLLAAAKATGCTVRMTRVAPRELDDDNLAGACKSIRDGIADALGINDRDKRVRWVCEQAKGKPARVEVRIDARAA